MNQMAAPKENYLRNLPLIFGINGLWSLLILLPVMVPFFESRGFGMAEVYQLQAIFGLTLLALEVPSGYFSDLLGRKQTLILATLFHGVGFSLFVWAESFQTFVIAEVILAIAVSLFSGTDLSLIYDSLLASESSKAPIKMVGRKLFYQQTGESIGGLLGGWLMIYSFNGPLWAQAVAAWLPLLLIVWIKEPPRIKMAKGQHKENFRYVLRSLFKHSQLLTWIILGITVFGAATLFAVWSFQKQWQNLGVPLENFGYLWAMTNFTVALTARYAHKFEMKLGSSAILILTGVLPIVGFFGMSLVHSVWAILFCLCFQISRGLNAVVLRDALNRRISSDLRATANSITSLGCRLIFILFGTGLGHLIDSKGLSSALFICGTLFGIATLVILFFTLKQRGSFESGPARKK